MGDGLIIICGLVFVFVVWVWTGGPTRPISFAGPFITPLTTVNDTQTGYGPAIGTPSVTSSGNSSGAGYWSLKSALGSYEGSAGNAGANTPTVANPSPFYGKVILTSGASGPTYSDTAREYVSFKNTSAAAVDVTGWTIVSQSDGSAAYIPQGAAMADARGRASLDDIVLAPGGEAVVYTRRSPAGGQSYRENSCTTYLNDRTRYDDCTKTSSRNSYFYGNDWLIYLNRTNDFWNDSHDTLRILDAQGRTVDQYSY